MMYVCDLSVHEGEGGETRVQDHRRLCREFSANLGSTRLCLKTNKQFTAKINNNNDTIENQLPTLSPSPERELRCHTCLVYNGSLSYTKLNTNF